MAAGLAKSPQMEGIRMDTVVPGMTATAIMKTADVEERCKIIQMGRPGEQIFFVACALAHLQKVFARFPTHFVGSFSSLVQHNRKKLLRELRFFFPIRVPTVAVRECASEEGGHRGLRILTIGGVAKEGSSFE